MQRTIIHIYLLSISVIIASLEMVFATERLRATPCNNRRPLLDSETTDLEVPFHLLFHGNRITSSSSIPNHPPSEVRMSGNGWCAQNMCTAGSESQQYLQVDFGAEVVVEAIAIASVNNDSRYVTKYYVEYGLDVNQLYCVISEESNGSIFDGVDICKRNSDAEVKKFSDPIVARFIRVVPLEWTDVSPCLRLELYGCYVKECSQIQDVSTNPDLLPAKNINFSTYFSASHRNISNVWCSNISDSSPSVNFTFTEPLYLPYAVVRGLTDDFFVSNFSLTYENPSDESMIYTNVDGISFFRLSNFTNQTILLWTPIATNHIQLSVHDKDNAYSCIGIQFYGCRYSEVIDHVSNEASLMDIATETVTPTSCTVRSLRSVITVTTTVLASSAPCSCSEQRQISATDVATIIVPVVVVFGVINVLVVVIIAILIWRKMKLSKSDSLPSNKVATTTTTMIVKVKNDLYGMESALSKPPVKNKEALDNGVQGNRKEPVKYDYPTTVIKPKQPVAAYETVKVHEEAKSEMAQKTSSTKTFASSICSEASNPHNNSKLQHNPMYVHVTSTETTDQS